MSHQLYFTLLLLVSLSLFSCRNNKKNAVKEEETVSFDSGAYLKSQLGENSLQRIENFKNLGYDSAVYQQDLSTIATYVKDINQELFHTRNGIIYFITEKGNGKTASDGDVIQVQVETTTLEGDTLFSTTQLGQYLEFTLGKAQVVPVWDQIFSSLEEGSRVSIIAPSALSYGVKGLTKMVNPNTILRYDVEILKIIQDENNVAGKDAPKLEIKTDSSHKSKKSGIAPLKK